MARKSKKVRASEPQAVGGFSFYASLFSLAVVLVVHGLALVRSWPVESFRSMGVAVVGLGLGTSFARWWFQGWAATYIHETKHAVLSGLVGNKPKEKVVREESGHFEYSYTKDTAQYNALIALAPYWLPLFSVPVAGAVLLLGTDSHLVRVGVVAFAYAVDVTTGIAEISPWQTDLTKIRGGYRVAVSYVILAHAVCATIFIAWVLGDVRGLSILAEAWWVVVKGLVGR